MLLRIYPMGVALIACALLFPSAADAAGGTDKKSKNKDKTGETDKSGGKSPGKEKKEKEKKGDKEEQGWIQHTHGGAKYYVFVPLTYKGEKEYPCILFLHGSGESGTDGNRQTTQGLGPWVDQHKKTFPFITVFPQARSDSSEAWAAGTADSKRALEILAEVRKKYKVDSHRIYLTGMSIGGHGTWCFAAQNPDMWAAIAPVAAWGPGVSRLTPGTPDAAVISKLKGVPAWIFHGSNDGEVPVAQARNMMKALKGATVKYTEYTGTDHGGTWNRAYYDAELYTWLAKHKR